MYTYFYISRYQITADRLMLEKIYYTDNTIVIYYHNLEFIISFWFLTPKSVRFCPLHLTKNPDGKRCLDLTFLARVVPVALLSTVLSCSQKLEESSLAFSNVTVLSTAKGKHYQNCQMRGKIVIILDTVVWILFSIFSKPPLTWLRFPISAIWDTAVSTKYSAR